MLSPPNVLIMQWVDQLTRFQSDSLIRNAEVVKNVSSNLMQAKPTEEGPMPKHVHVIKDKSMRSAASFLYFKMLISQGQNS